VCDEGEQEGGEEAPGHRPRKKHSRAAQQREMSTVHAHCGEAASGRAGSTPPRRWDAATSWGSCAWRRMSRAHALRASRACHHWQWHWQRQRSDRRNCPPPSASVWKEDTLTGEHFVRTSAWKEVNRARRRKCFPRFLVWLQLIPQRRDCLGQCATPSACPHGQSLFR
jgi:hypothetical protein